MYVYICVFVCVHIYQYLYTCNVYVHTHVRIIFNTCVSVHALESIYASLYVYIFVLAFELLIYYNQFVSLRKCLRYIYKTLSNNSLSCFLCVSKKIDKIIKLCNPKSHFLCISIYLFMYMFIYVFFCVYTHTHTHTHTENEISGKKVWRK